MSYIGQDALRVGLRDGQADRRRWFRAATWRCSSPRRVHSTSSRASTGRSLRSSSRASPSTRRPSRRAPTCARSSRRSTPTTSGHKNLKGMFAVDAGDTQGVGQVIQKYSCRARSSGGGYDLLPGHAQADRPGVRSKFTIDQQPYLQGFYPVHPALPLQAVRRPGGAVGHQHGPAVRDEGQRQAVPDDEDRGTTAARRKHKYPVT